MKSKSSRFLNLALAFILSVSVFILPMTASAASPRAISIPTQLAPESWYDVSHQWTAVNYTYSSYIFDGDYDNYAAINVTAHAAKPFRIEAYDTSNHKFDSMDAVYYNGQYIAALTLQGEDGDPEQFYIILRNLSSDGAITLDDNADYSVWRLEPL